MRGKIFEKIEINEKNKKIEVKETRITSRLLLEHIILFFCLGTGVIYTDKVVMFDHTYYRGLKASPPHKIC
jgi:hypothetical protein